MARYCIVGGVAGGASAAARLRRLDESAEIVLFERGPYISYANCGLPYYSGGVIQERERLFVMTPEKFAAWLKVDVRTNTEVLAIDRRLKQIAVRNLASGEEYRVSYEYLVLSPGAEPIIPKIQGVDDDAIFTLRSVQDIDRIVAFMEQEKFRKREQPARAVIVGGGFIGLEMAENLSARGLSVSVVEALNQVMNPLDFEMAAMVHRELRSKGIDLYLGAAVESFGRKDDLIQVRLAGGASLEANMVLLSIGVRPEGRLAAEAGLDTAPNGAILVDRHLRTKDPAILALGDAIAFPHPILGAAMAVPLAGPANKQARVVADTIIKGEAGRSWQGAIGTSIAKVFDLTVGATGASEKQLKKSGIPYRTLITHGSSHAGYYPGSRPLTIKTLFAPDSGRLLGAQVVGGDGVDARLNLLSETIRHSGSVAELGEIEQAYAPPFSSAKDPVNIAGMAAENLLAGLTDVVQWHEVDGLRGSGAFFLDVRTAEEFALGTIPGAVNIPLEQLRARLQEIPHDRKLVVFCAVGLRGYLAERILRQSGWSDIANLSGGYKTWETATEPAATVVAEAMGPAGAASARPSAQFSARPSAPLPAATPSSGASVKTELKVDACGLQCPGPIMRLKTEIDRLAGGDRLIINASDPGFARDVASWCRLTGNALVSLKESAGVYTAIIEKTGERLASADRENSVCYTGDAATFIIFSNDLDKALASFVLANGALASGKSVTMFFTFWGLSVVKRPEKVSVTKDFMGKMFGAMLPKSAAQLSLSRLNMGGIGSAMMKSRMKAKNVDMVETMMAQAIQSGARLIACQMSMDIMGVKKEELLDGVEVGGVATYMEAASAAGLNLFI